MAAAALFGASTPVAKRLLGAMDPWLLAGVLYLGSGLGLSALGWLLPGDRARLGRRDWPWLLGAILAGGVAGPVLLLLGLRGSAAAAASLLLNAEGVFTALLAWLVFKENADRRIVLGMAAIVAGAVVLSWQGPVGGTVAVWPSFCILGACLCWAVDNNLTRRIALADPLRIAAVKGLGAGATNVVLALILGARGASPGVVAVGALVGFFGYGLSLAAFVLALRDLGAARTGAYFSTAPFVGALLSVLALGEAVTPRLLLAGGLMAVGLWLHMSERHEHDHAHETLAHDHAHEHDAHHQHAHAGAEAASEPHRHFHRHAPLVHRHPHFPDAHHRHGHGGPDHDHDGHDHEHGEA